MFLSSVICHSAEHILAAAVINLFPNAQFISGSSCHDGGFYYDVEIGRALTPDDLFFIEKEIATFLKEESIFELFFMSKSEAINLFQKLNQKYKIQILNQIQDSIVTLYKTQEFIDLCKGPHLFRIVENTVVKLRYVSGNYWRNNKKCEMLQRISGVAFANKKQLKLYLSQVEECKKRDHRKLGTALELFSVSDSLIGPGLITWLPKGSRIRIIIENFLREIHYKCGYEVIFSPHIAKNELWKVSGHWEFYKDNMFDTIVVDKCQYLLKPMNCPFHLMVYLNKSRSYRELPLRYAEFGTVYRNELAGTMHGLMRVRGFTQDDAHLFCRLDQIEEELAKTVFFAISILKRFGFLKFAIKLSTRPEKFVGNIKNWEIAESALHRVLDQGNFAYSINSGAGAFYGPKIDIELKDSLGRFWQCSTIQVDFNNPNRFKLSFINSDGLHEEPIMIHRALLGSLERFVGILIEEYNGAFPFWFAPEQVRILTVSDKQLGYARNLEKALCNFGLRVFVSLINDKLGNKIRLAELSKIPVMLIIGERDIIQSGATVREHSGRNLGFMCFDDIILYCLSLM